MTSPVELCAQALLKLGATPIASFSDDRAEAQVANVLYASTRDMLLGHFPWRFAVATQKLNRLLDVPQASEFAYAFQLPNDYIRALQVNNGEAYRIVRQSVQANSPDVTLTYLFRAPEGEFPPHFQHALIARLAAEFCLPITENAARADMLRKQAEQELQRAKRVDTQQDTPQALQHFSLLDARQGG